MSKAKSLGKLRGPIASGSEPSRNGRKYTNGFWDSYFDSDLFKEGLDNKVIFGELYHPDDENEYEQIHCDDRAAVVLTDVKKENSDYIGTFDILPTKAGECLRKLLDLGCIFGISSRGLAKYDRPIYDAQSFNNGEFDVITWDVVAMPGLKSCRLHEISPIAEGFKFSKKNKIQIKESLSNLVKDDDFLREYADHALKVKEDFNTDIQIEDIMARFGIPDEDVDLMNIVEFDDKGTPVYNDGVHGLKPVVSPFSKFNRSGNPGDMYSVDNIHYNEESDNYWVTGDWVYIANIIDEMKKEDETNG